MIVASYVHLMDKDTFLFPLQPNEPVIPLMLIFMAAYVLWRGGGAWSIDLKNFALSGSIKFQHALRVLMKAQENKKTSVILSVFFLV